MTAVADQEVKPPEVYRSCGGEVRTMAFKGTGYCCGDCEKAGPRQAEPDTCHHTSAEGCTGHGDF